MNLHKDCKVLYTGKGGYGYEKQHANEHLTAGSEYTVLKVGVGAWISYVTLKEFPDVSFNSAHFQKV